MSSVQDTYLGWELEQHQPDCKRPEWVVDSRTEHEAWRGRDGGPAHSCPNGDCTHSDRFEKLTVRIMCRSCGKATVFTGEARSESYCSTARLGYGQPPRKVAGLWLWPGAPLLYELDTEPHGYLVTATRVDRVTKADVVGQITQGRGKRGGVIWTAAAAPAPDGQYGNLDRLRWRHVHEGAKTPAAAAKWIAARLADTDESTASTEGGDVR